MDPSPLTPAQQAAATHGDGPMLVIAGPGSGKTRTLTLRLCHLIESGHAAPQDLLAVTFTRKAAEEVRSRLSALLGPRAALLTVGTFHAVAALVCPPEGPVLSEGDRQALVRRAAQRAGVEVRRLSETLCHAKGNQGSDLAVGLDPDLAAGLSAYEELLRAVGAIDLDDLLIRAWQALRDGHARRRWRYVSVDEYQDVNRVQRELLRELGGGTGNVFAIGDPDQAIYAFRGADVRNFFAFGDDYPGARVVSLSDNFRSTATIVRAAAAVIGHNQKRASLSELVPGALVDAPRAAREAGQHVTRIDAPGEAAEAERIVAEIERLLGGTSLHSYDTGRAAAAGPQSYTFADIAVLSRTAARADALAEALDRAGLPIQRPRRSLFDREEARELLAYLRFAASAGETDLGAHFRVLAREVPAILPALEQHPERGLGGALDTLCAQDAGLRDRLSARREELATLPPAERIAVLAAKLATPPEIVTAALCRLERHGEQALCCDDGTAHESDELDPRAERVSVLTLHGSKGLEFPVVFVAGCEAALLPGEQAGPDEVEEERRLFYVGMTRARDRLYLSWARRGRRGEGNPSPFLGEIPASLLSEVRCPEKRKQKSQMRLF